MTAMAQPARLLGIPLGDFGFFSAILLSLASGFFAFFASEFLSIIGLLFWNILGHHTTNYADAYRYIAFPIGLVVLVFGFCFFLSVWFRRRVTGVR
jgi:hypothetical protein